MQTIIEIRPHFGGWKVFGAQGGEPYFSEREQAIHYASTRTALRRGEIRILSAQGGIDETIAFDEGSDWGARHQGSFDLA
ncbi:MAG: hypothetical protein DMF06_05710 [Verrucomicrobia bacterium]|nr:MAG: hypothetical protein DMF06_05710 [Verrucomicrobiota bacterium]